MKKIPNNIVYSKQHKVKNLKGNKGINVNRYTCGLLAEKSTNLTYEQIESARRAIVRVGKTKSKKKGQQKNAKSSKIIKKKSRKKKKNLWIKSNFWSPQTKKPLQVRMGKGKGATDKWVFPARKSRVLFEMSRQQNKLGEIRSLLKLSTIKLPIKTRFIFDKHLLRREAFCNYLIKK